MRVRLFILLALGLAPLATLSQMYSWKDASGKVYYGDKPPAGKKEAARTLQAPLPPEDAGNRRKAFLERQMAEREKAQKSAKAAAEKAAASPPPASPQPSGK